MNCACQVSELLYLNLNSNKESTFILDPSLRQAKITFDDLPSAVEEEKAVPSTYRRLKWTEISYGHELFLKKSYPKSGYATAFIPGGSPHIAFFAKEASISFEHFWKKFTLISLTACAAWTDDLQLTITGYRNSIEINAHTTILLFGKPQLILLQWKNIDKVIFQPFGGITHPGSGDSGATYVAITQLTIGPLD
jgi:hypothetical protein